MFWVIHSKIFIETKKSKNVNKRYYVSDKGTHLILLTDT